jgi:site-specific DNA-methyltransferase (adenine-specific)
MPELPINQIICGNCLEVMKGWPDMGVSLVLTDPPYGIGLAYDKYQDTDANWYKLMQDSVPEFRRVGKMVILPSCKIQRLKWIYDKFPPDWLICWYKGSPGHAAYIGFNDWEPHLVYGRTRNRLYMHDHFQTRSSPPKGKFNHPCPKPIEWATWLIERSTVPDDLILDPFCGSGTVCVAAKQLGRRYIGIDISQDYCDIARNRISVESGNDERYAT